ncbi:glycoside hydrolase family 99-like domain-containing protein [Aeromicrobium sp. 50.2.37]|uniref:glycosyltransferase WbsX family protein n=1 Tax=Aeromicrobium sp. 50.2.37 TaxID=2969305 RepID=UPI0021501716|nr:glycoside hydrolase family 99-like domain-containing protein [Aeromicrobium sp. 50.2.37]MCR4513039.1 glycoside hydrolase family 99-like domain-containing protein [Aeromicrobium sp. 50.2.37]
MAFYLPQFHAIPENDEWWGEGFTEWTNVRRSRPAFDGHDHPRVPRDLGYYDLGEPADVMKAQIKLARAHGVDAFCFYAYWFDGYRLLERPIDWYANHGPDFPFCVSWANESWTRRWDGKNSEVLMPQSYAPGYVDRLFEDFAGYFTAPHALKVQGRPVFLVHRADQLPDAPAFAATVRARAARLGLPGIHLVAAETVRGLDPRPLGFDGVAEFPPVGMNTTASAVFAPLQGLRKDFRGRILSYEKMVHRAERRADENRYVRYPGVNPGWDNSARRGSRATVYVGSNPGLYRSWLQNSRRREHLARGGDGIVFVNAWNEWAEGAYLEPDQTWGDGYLRATVWDASSGGAQEGKSLAAARSRFWSRGQTFSVGMLLGGSALNSLRSLRRKTALVTSKLLRRNFA